MNLKRIHFPKPLEFTIGLLLLAHVVLLAWSATRHAPVVDETGHLPAGLSHWNLRRFDLYCVNPSYRLFEATLKPLGQYEFFSTALTGQEHGALNGESGNRFTGSWLEHVPVPVPRNVLQGIDWLKFEYERGYPSYLRGVKRDGGWWYYYLYAMLVKMPVGTLALLAMA
jgi:hypothetical protein